MVGVRVRDEPRDAVRGGAVELERPLRVHDPVRGALEQQRSVLERKVEQLRGFERDYRSRLKAYIEGQLRDLDARGSVAAPEVEATS